MPHELAVPGLANLRRVAGASDGVILRSVAPDGLDEHGIEALRELGVTTIIDLREPHERSVPEGTPFRVLSLPIYGTPDTPLAGHLEDLYEQLLGERAAELAAAVGEVARAEGGVLIHCKIGKDRTGLIVALVRMVAGHSDDEIIADYAQSAAELRTPEREASVFSRLDALGLSDDDYAASARLHLESPAEAMRHVLDWIRARGGAERYLLDAGLAPRDLELLQNRVSSGAEDAS